MLPYMGVLSIGLYRSSLYDTLCSHSHRNPIQTHSHAIQNQMLLWLDFLARLGTRPIMINNAAVWRPLSSTAEELATTYQSNC